jgi:hypothetical protein
METDQRRGSSIHDRLNLSPKNGIPMPDYHIQRTESELQLNEDMAMAEYRDKCMFNRLVTGIQQRRQHHFDSQQHQLYYTQGGHSTNTNTTRRFRTKADNARTPLPRSMLISSQTDADQGLSDRAIANILNTRSLSFTQKKDSSTHAIVNSKASSMITPMTSDGEDARPEADVAAASDDWAIESFGDDMPSPTYSRPVVCDPWWQDSHTQFSSTHATSNQSDNNLFDMDL